MNGLPIIYSPADGQIAVADPDTGDVLPLAEASDHAIAHAASELADHDRDILGLKRALAVELQARYGVGKARVGGYDLTVTEAQSWPVGATEAALKGLLARGIISQGDFDRCMPLKPKPNPRQIKALVGRLIVKEPLAAKTLTDAATVSPVSVRDIQHVVPTVLADE